MLGFGGDGIDSSSSVIIDNQSFTQHETELDTYNEKVASSRVRSVKDKDYSPKRQRMYSKTSGASGDMENSLDT